MKVLVFAERVRGRLDDAVTELATAARALAGGEPVAAAAFGEGLDADTAVLAGLFDVVHVLDDAAVALPDAERDGALLRRLVDDGGYAAVLFVHDNRALDLAPPLAARLGRPLVTDVLAFESDEGGLHAHRAVFGGKLQATYAVDGAGGLLLTLRGGAFAPASGGGAGEVRLLSLPADLPSRRRPLRTVEPDAGEVDISAAEILVGVGRGIEDEENLELVQDLANALGGEVACSRPVVDKGWLPKSRQVGTSGMTVKPKVYFAVGISGSFQHVGGIKGAPFVVAVNKDPKAPIFGFADVGVVGDLFEFLPVLTEKIQAARA